METPIYFEMPETITIDIMGNKVFNIDTKGNEKKRFSVLLTIVGDGTKLAAVLIFKGKKRWGFRKINKQKYTCIKKRNFCFSSGNKLL